MCIECQMYEVIILDAMNLVANKTGNSKQKKNKAE